ncbi:hypothetical protein MRX96_057902 [Rhipicephalus microplus]
MLRRRCVQSDAAEEKIAAHLSRPRPVSPSRVARSFLCGGGRAANRVTVPVLPLTPGRNHLSSGLTEKAQVTPVVIVDEKGAPLFLGGRMVRDTGMCKWCQNKRSAVVRCAAAKERQRDSGAGDGCSQRTARRGGSVLRRCFPAASPLQRRSVQGAGDEEGVRRPFPSSALLLPSANVPIFITIPLPPAPPPKRALGIVFETLATLAAESIACCSSRQRETHVRAI